MSSAVERDANWFEDSGAGAAPKESTPRRNIANAPAGKSSVVKLLDAPEGGARTAKPWASPAATPRARAARRIFAIVFASVLALLAVEVVVFLQSDGNAQYETNP